MTARSVYVYNGSGWDEIGLSVTAAQIPAGGSTSQVLSKASNTDYDLAWTTVDALPSQTSNSGKYLTTNGTTASWATVAAGTTTADVFMLMGA